MFEIRRGTKQGDPLSSLLFRTVLQAAMEDDLSRWREKGMGITLGDLQADLLSNLRFADDVLLISASLEQLRSMMCEFKKSTESVGLKIHRKERKPSNQGSNRRKEVTIDNIKVEFLTVKECAKYLCQTKIFKQQERQLKSRVGSEQHGHHLPRKDRS